MIIPSNKANHNFQLTKTEPGFPLSILIYSSVFQRTEPVDCYRHGEQEREEVGACLAHLYALKAKEMRQDDNQWNEEQAVARCCKDVGLPRLAYGLHHHVGVHNYRAERQRYQLPAQGHTANGDNGWVVAEHGYDVGREKEAQQYADKKKGRAMFYYEPVSLAHPGVKVCAVTKAAHRLKALAEAYHGGENHKRYTAYDRHAGNGGVAEPSGSHVKQRHAYTRHALAGERWRATGKYLTEHRNLRSKVVEMYPYGTALVRHQQQYEHAARLADECGNTRARYAHVKNEYQNRCKHDVDYGTGKYSEHGVCRVALETHLVVKTQRTTHERHGHEDEGKVTVGVRQYGRRRPEKQGYGLEQEQAYNTAYNACNNSTEKARGGHTRGIVVALGPKFARYVVARPLAEGEPYGLYYRHYGECYAHGGRGLRANTTNVKRCNDVVDTRYKHAYYCRHRHGIYDFVNRRGCQECKVVPVVHIRLF